MEHIHGGPMAGQTVLVTGATSGIGQATALGLATMGAHLAVTGRDRGRTETLPARSAQPEAEMSRCSSRTCPPRRRCGGWPARCSSACQRIDVLINNAGGYWSSRHVTADGLERTFALNHLAPFLLTNLLLDRLELYAPELEQVSGRYFANRRPTRSSTRSNDRAVAARLWEASADLVGLSAAPRV